MPNHQRCLICDLAVRSFQNEIQRDLYIVNCYRCGSYIINQSASTALYNYFVDERKRTNLSGWVSENQPYIKIKYDDFEKLSNLRTPSVGERATKLLLYIEKLLPSLNATLPSNHIYITIQALESPNFPKVSGFDKDEAINLVPMLSISWSLDWNELEYLIREYLWDTKKYIDISGDNNIMITPEGWAFLESLRYGNPDSQIGFIAMKFDEDLIQYSKDWIEKGILDAGYQPKAMYDHQHNNIIDDEMIALIKRSRFVVVDLTMKSLGAYYEAGFGHGLGLEVIFLCKKSYFKNHKKDIHFDVNHRLIILWEKDKGEELAKMLQNRIESTSIGKGNYNR